MWRHSGGVDQVDGAAVKDKQIEDSQGDSGFISSDNLLCSQHSIDSDNEEPSRDNVKIAPEPAKASESGLLLGVNADLSKLSLIDVDTETQLDSGIIDVKSEDLISGEIHDEETQKPKVNVTQWQLYYAQDDDGDTQLHLAIIQEFTEAVYYLIDLAPHSCLLDIQNDDWDSALHLAVLTKQANIVRKLVLAGADPTVRNFQGDTPLHLACAMGTMDCIKALTCPPTQFERSTLGDKRPASLPQDLQMRNYNGQMCIHLATIKGEVDVLRHLLSVGADVNGFEALSGYTALHLAIGRGMRDIAVFLVSEGRAKLDAKSYGGRTAYGMARRNDAKLAAELFRLGTKPSQPLDMSSDSESDEDDDEEVDTEDEEESNAKFCEVIEKLNMASPLVK